MVMMRERVINELERVVQCREIARAAWRQNPVAEGTREESYRLQSLGEFNETIQALKDALLHNAVDLMVKALELSERTP